MPSSPSACACGWCKFSTDSWMPQPVRGGSAEWGQNGRWQKWSEKTSGTATRHRQSDYMTESKVLQPNLTAQILFTWTFYPPIRPHIAPKVEILGKNFIKVAPSLVTCNYHLANYVSYLAISSNSGIFQNISQIVLLVSNNKLNPSFCLLSCHYAQQRHSCCHGFPSDACTSKGRVWSDAAKRRKDTFVFLVVRVPAGWHCSTLEMEATWWNVALLR